MSEYQEHEEHPQPPPEIPEEAAQPADDGWHDGGADRPEHTDVAQAERTQPEQAHRDAIVDIERQQPAEDGWQDGGRSSETPQAPAGEARDASANDTSPPDTSENGATDDGWQDGSREAEGSTGRDRSPERAAAESPPDTTDHPDASAEDEWEQTKASEDEPSDSTNHEPPTDEQDSPSRAAELREPYDAMPGRTPTAETESAPDARVGGERERPEDSDDAPPAELPQTQDTEVGDRDTSPEQWDEERYDREALHPERETGGTVGEPTSAPTEVSDNAHEDTDAPYAPEEVPHEELRDRQPSDSERETLGTKDADLPGSGDGSRMALERLYDNVGEGLHERIPLERWDAADSVERAAIVQEANGYIRDQYGLAPSDIEVGGLPDDTLGLFDPNTGHMAVNDSLLSESRPYELFDTLAHENRHALQEEVLSGRAHHPLGDLGRSELAAWKRGVEEYDGFDLYGVGYSYNALETDANAAGSRVSGAYKAAAIERLFLQRKK